MTKPTALATGAEPEATDKFSKRAMELLSVARGVEINNVLDYEDAVALRVLCRDTDKQAEELFAPMKAAAHAAWKAVCEREQQVREGYKAAVVVIDGKILTYRKQEAARAAAEEKAREEEKAKMVAELEASGRGTEAAIVAAAPVVAVQPSIPKVAGISGRVSYVARVEDEVRAIIWIVDGKDPGQGAKLAHPELANMLKLDTTALNRLARAQREAMHIPGVAVMANETLVQR